MRFELKKAFLIRTKYLPVLFARLRGPPDTPQSKTTTAAQLLCRGDVVLSYIVIYPVMAHKMSRVRTRSLVSCFSFSRIIYQVYEDDFIFRFPYYTPVVLSTF